jgi:hypothetical protein
MKKITDAALGRAFDTITTALEARINVEHEQVPPGLLAFDDQGSPLGELIESEVLNKLQGFGFGKDTVSRVIRTVLQETPVGLDSVACIAHITEAWAAKYDKDEESLAKALVAAGVPAGQQSRSRDVVMVLMHTTDGPSVNIVEIYGDGKARTMTRPATFTTRGTVTTEGRMADGLYVAKKGAAA